MKTWVEAVQTKYGVKAGLTSKIDASTLGKQITCILVFIQF